VVSTPACRSRIAALWRRTWGVIVLAASDAHRSAARASFVRRRMLTTNVSTVLIGSAMIGTFVLVPQLAQLPKGGDIGFGLSATQAGLLLAPGSLVSLLLIPRRGGRTTAELRAEPAAS
jgi:hypothetical protein